LALVLNPLANPPQPKISEILDEPILYTQWGTDPISPKLGGTDVYPTSNLFRWQANNESKLAYPGSPNSLANIIAYPVQFDNEQNCGMPTCKLTHSRAISHLLS